MLVPSGPAIFPKREEESKKGLDTFYLISQLLEQNLISYDEDHGYQIVGSEIYLTHRSNKLMFKKRESASKTAPIYYSYMAPKEYKLEEIFDELPAEFKAKIIFYLDLGV